MTESKSGFSLVELLVATTIMAIVGALAVACLFSVMHVNERCASDTASVAIEFVDRFESDAASAIAARGVDGGSDKCSFWIRESAPCVIRHETAPRAVQRVAMTPDGEKLSSEVFHGIGKLVFSYGFLDDAGEITWADSASPDSAVPSFIRVTIEGLPPRVVEFGKCN